MTTEEKIQESALLMCICTGVRYVECLFNITATSQVIASKEFMICLWDEHLDYQLKMNDGNLATEYNWEIARLYALRLYNVYGVRIEGFKRPLK